MYVEWKSKSDVYFIWKHDASTINRYVFFETMFVAFGLEFNGQWKMYLYLI